MVLSKTIASLISHHLIKRNVGLSAGKLVTNEPVVYAVGEERFQVRQAGVEDTGKATAFLIDTLVRNEPLCWALGMRHDEMMETLWHTAERCIPHGLCSIVSELHSQQIAAVRLFGVVHKHDSPNTVAVRLSRRAQILANFLEETRLNFWNQAGPDVYRVITNEAMSVSPMHMRKGIGTMLLTHLIDRETVNRLDVQGMRCEATSIASQKLLQKNGYRMLEEIKHVDYLNAQGRRIFECEDGTDRIVLYYKDLLQQNENLVWK